MSKTEKLNEEKLFKQELDDDELKAVSGGEFGIGEHCDTLQYRWRAVEGCVATVEVDFECMKNDSWCMSGDACKALAIVYV